MAIAPNFIIIANLMQDKKLKYYLPPLVWAALILAVSSIPQLKTPSLGFDWVDKLFHFGEYFIFGLLLGRGLGGARRWFSSALIMATCIAGIFGIVDELHQYFIPGRSTDIYDMLADILGSFLGALTYIYWQRRRSRVQAHPSANKS